MSGEAQDTTPRNDVLRSAATTEATAPVLSPIKSSEGLGLVVRTYLENFLSPRTRDAYTEDLVGFTEFLKAECIKQGLALPKHPREITRTHVIAWRESLRVRYAPMSVNRKMSALSSLFKELQEAQLVKENPVDGVKRPEAKIKRPRTGFKDAEVVRVLESFDEGKLQGLQSKTLFAFLFYTGVRVSEALSVRVKDIELQGGVPVVHIQGKGDRHRVLPLNHKLYRLTKELVERRSKERSDFLFTRVQNDRGEKMDRSSVLKLMKDTLKRLGLDPSRSPHSTRRTLISNLLENGARLESVQKIAGHAQPTTTVKYNVRDEKIEDNPLLRVGY